MFKTAAVLEHEATGHDVAYRISDRFWVCFDCDWTKDSQDRNYAIAKTLGLDDGIR